MWHVYIFYQYKLKFTIIITGILFYIVFFLINFLFWNVFISLYSKLYISDISFIKLHYTHKRITNKLKVRQSNLLFYD